MKGADKNYIVYQNALNKLNNYCEANQELYPPWLYIDVSFLPWVVENIENPPSEMKRTCVVLGEGSACKVSHEPKCMAW